MYIYVLLIICVFFALYMYCNTIEEKESGWTTLMIVFVVCGIIIGLLLFLIASLVFVRERRANKQKKVSKTGSKPPKFVVLKETETIDTDDVTPVDEN